MRKVFLKTYGCQMNVRDSEALAGMLVRAGYEITGKEAEADVMIFNTCSVRDQAERKAIGKMTAMKQYKRFKPHLLIGVMGCMAQHRGQELLEKLPHLDFVLGTGRLHTLIPLLEELTRAPRRVLDTTTGDEVLESMGSHYSADPEHTFTGYVAITRGCNRFCSYCIVPYVRGREYSREPAAVLKEARELVAGGVKEIMLLGQNVAAYGLNGDVRPPAPDHSPFADLLLEMAKIDGLQRIRFTSPYPSYFNDRLIAAMASEPKICRSVHLPLQSGSAAILKAMNRQYTPELYLEIVAKLRQAMPEITFSTDVIVGFPGESDADFAATRDLMNQVGFDNAYVFKYSPRPGTKSAAMPDDVPQEIKEERNQILLADLEKRSLASNLGYVGSTQEILCEGPSPRNPERWYGKTGTAKTVIFYPEPGTRAGELVSVRIERASRMSLFGPGVIGEEEEP